jgi:hypothetical protein
VVGELGEQLIKEKPAEFQSRRAYKEISNICQIIQYLVQPSQMVKIIL